MMTRRRRPSRLLPALRALPRIALLTAALFAPLVVMQSVQAGSETIIEDKRPLSNGAGLVLLIGLQRS